MRRFIDRFKSDHPDPVRCQVRGFLPDWLNGWLYRNGPGVFSFGEDTFRHIFDGMAVLQKFSIQDGNVEYCNQLLKSKAYTRNKKSNRIVVSEFGTMASPDPLKPICTRYFSYFYDFLTMPTDNASINVVELWNKLFAMTEPPLLSEIEPTSLATKAHVDLRNYVDVTLATAHPLRDALETVWNIGTSVSHASHYTVFRIPAKEKFDSEDPFLAIDVVCKIPCRWKLEPGYVHSFGMSENYLALVEQTLTMPLLTIFSSPFRGTSILDAMKYYPEEKCIFHIVDKTTAQPLGVKFVADPFFVFHHMNSFEDNDHLVIDLCCYSDASVLKCFEIAYKGREVDDAIDKALLENTSSCTSYLWRFVLPLNSSKWESKAGCNLVTLDYTTATAVRRTDGTIFCTPQVFGNCVIELGQINDKMAGRKHRYCYGVKTRNNPPIPDSELIKFDMLRNESRIWSDEKFIAGEPIFVANPKSNAEDDGIILSAIVSKSEELKSALLILDAQTFSELARAEIPTNVQVPLSFHGFFRKSELQK